MSDYINVKILNHNLIARDGLKCIWIDLNSDFKCQTMSNNEEIEFVHDPMKMEYDRVNKKVIIYALSMDLDKISRLEIIKPTRRVNKLLSNELDNLI
jgi:hypothetical protein